MSNIVNLVYFSLLSCPSGPGPVHIVPTYWIEQQLQSSCSSTKLILADSFFIDYTLDEVSSLIEAASFIRSWPIVNWPTMLHFLICLAVHSPRAINKDYKAPGHDGMVLIFVEYGFVLYW